MPSPQDVLVRIGATSAALDREMARTKRSVQSARGSIERSVRGIDRSFATGFGGVERSISRARSALLAFGAIAALGVAVRRFREIERNVAMLRGLVGLTKEETKALADQFGRIAIETGQAQTAISKAAFFITSAGLRGKSALGALEKSAQLATAGLGDMESIARSLTAAMNTYGPATLDAARAADDLALAVRLGAFEASELAPTLGKILPIAAAAGVEFNQFLAAIALISRTGAPVAEIVTELSSAMKALIAPTVRVKQFAKDMGVDFTALQKTMRTDLLQAFRDLNETLGGNVEHLRRVLGSSEALVAVLTLLGLEAKDVDAVFADMADSAGTLKDALDPVVETVDNKLNRAFQRFDDGLQKILQGTARPFLIFIEELEQGFRALGRAMRSEDVGVLQFQLKSLVGTQAAAIQELEVLDKLSRSRGLSPEEEERRASIRSDLNRLRDQIARKQSELNALMRKTLPLSSEGGEGEVDPFGGVQERLVFMRGQRAREAREAAAAAVVAAAAAAEEAAARKKIADAQERREAAGKAMIADLDRQNALLTLQLAGLDAEADLVEKIAAFEKAVAREILPEERATLESILGFRREITEDAEKEAAAQKRINKALAETEALVERARNAARPAFVEIEETARKLDELLAKGDITASERAALLSQMQAAASQLAPIVAEIEDEVRSLELAFMDVGDAAADALESFVFEGGKAIDIARELAREIGRIGFNEFVRGPVRSGITDLFSGAGRFLGGAGSLFGGGGAAALSPAQQLAGGLIPLQHGGRFAGGETLLVGERRPEIIRFDRPGQVFPSVGDAARKLGETRQSVQVVMNINAPVDVEGFKRARSNLMAGAFRDASREARRRN